MTTLRSQRVRTVVSMQCDTGFMSAVRASGRAAQINSRHCGGLSSDCQNAEAPLRSTMTLYIAVRRPREWMIAIVDNISELYLYLPSVWVRVVAGSLPKAVNIFRQSQRESSLRLIFRAGLWHRQCRQMPRAYDVEEPRKDGCKIFLNIR